MNERFSSTVITYNLTVSNVCTITLFFYFFRIYKSIAEITVIEKLHYTILVRRRIHFQIKQIKKGSIAIHGVFYYALRDVIRAAMGV